MSLRIVFDRVAASFGYARISKMHTNIAADDAVQPETIPAHLQAEAHFDYSKIRNKKDWWSFFYAEEDGFHYAIGRRDWMPLMMAGFVAGGNSLDGMKLMAECISERMWISPENQIHQSWHQANKAAIASVESVDVAEVPLEDESATEFDPEMFIHLRASVISMELRAMWRRYMPYRPEFMLASSMGHNLLCKLPMMRRAYEAPEAAMSQLLEWTADWFEARGFRVDREERLVQVMGYEPLFAFDSDPGRC